MTSRSFAAHAPLEPSASSPTAPPIFNTERMYRYALVCCTFIPTSSWSDWVAQVAWSRPHGMGKKIIKPWVGSCKILRYLAIFFVTFCKIFFQINGLIDRDRSDMTRHVPSVPVSVGGTLPAKSRLWPSNTCFSAIWGATLTGGADTVLRPPTLLCDFHESESGACFETGHIGALKGGRSR